MTSEASSLSFRPPCAAQGPQAYLTPARAILKHEGKFRSVQMICRGEANCRLSRLLDSSSAPDFDRDYIGPGFTRKMPGSCLREGVDVSIRSGARGSELKHC